MNRGAEAWRRMAGALVVALALFAAPAADAQPDVTPGGFNLNQITEEALAPGQISDTLLLLIVLTLLSLLPAFIMLTTAFPRIIIVFGFLRQAMATQQTPPNQVLIGLALILTIYIMMPTYQAVYDEAVIPYTNEEIGFDEMLTRGLEPIRAFMFRQAGAEDIALFMNIRNMERPGSPDDVPTDILTAAFMVGELRRAFQIGFMIYIPFLIIDMVVASTLMAMGMMMLPPVFVSLPFKIIMFVLADGWYLLVESLMQSFN